MPTEGFEFTDEKKAFLIDDKDFDYVESLIEALTLYKKLAKCGVPRGIGIREDRLKVWQRLMNSIEDWMSLCLYCNFTKDMRENWDVDAMSFVLSHIISHEDEE